MTDNHLSFRENLAAYALGALDADETTALQAHLKTCDSCRAELAGYQQISSGLLSALPPKAPRPALKQGLVARLPRSQKALRPRWQWRWSFGQLATAALFTFLLGLNLVALFQVRALHLQQVKLSRQLHMQQTALAMVASPHTDTFPVIDGNVAGTLIVDEDKNTALLILADLPALEEGKTYQIWLIQPDNQRVSAGLIDPNRENSITITSLISKDSLQNYTGIGVTVEPAGGSDQPTGPRMFGVEF